MYQICYECRMRKVKKILADDYEIYKMGEFECP